MQTSVTFYVKNSVFDVSYENILYEQGQLLPTFKNWTLILAVEWRYEWNNLRRRPPYKNVRVGYSIHNFIKRPKSIF